MLFPIRRSFFRIDLRFKYIGESDQGKPVFKVKKGCEDNLMFI